jgi:hypothetical protein
MQKYNAGWFCSDDCAITYAVTKARKDRDKQLRAESRQIKESIKTRSDWMREAQVEFNKYIRYRDHYDPCISCGRFHTGQYHAGHYRTVGSTKGNRLRYTEDNCHKQCSACNNHKSGDIVNYRINLLAKIGEERLRWLEGHHEPHRYMIDELKEIKAEYRKRASDIKKRIDGNQMCGDRWLRTGSPGRQQ